jgi:LAO/AO transport system kinase
LKSPGAESLVRRALSGDRRSIARLISLVEDGGADLGAVMEELYPHTGSAYTIGVTGAPGSGKSTLTEKIVARARTDRCSVGVLAVDPSSPFSGGALLGDRVRMQAHATDPEVFIRSMATRGHLGGISLATPEAVRVLDAVGKDIVVIETVGVGQAEVEITDACDTAVVVVNPGWGDAVQAAKAGLMEIADVFVVNKADRQGAKETVRELRAMLELSDSRWKPEIVMSVATRGEGIDELWAALHRHREYQQDNGLLAARRRRRIAGEIKEIAVARYRRRVDIEDVDLLRQLTDDVLARKLDPYAAADSLVQQLAEREDAFVRNSARP